ncbi:MAG: substrate-binding domain-containing protein [Armatimonadota bacterium]|nr:substrate-binding domain-containing protein [Armatimonadota bacterium]
MRFSLAGFDDVDLAALSFPPLTTMRQSGTTARERGAELLLAHINGKQELGQKVCLQTEQTELIVRHSAFR